SYTQPYVQLIYQFTFFFNDTSATEIYTLSLHDALPILPVDIQSGALCWTNTPALSPNPSPQMGEGKVPVLCQPQSANFGSRLTRSEEHTSELQSRENLVCRLLLEKKKINKYQNFIM